MTKPGFRRACLFLIAGMALLPAESRAGGAPGSTASFPVQIATYPEQGMTRVPADATLYFVFDQPTNKTGIFEVADLDPSSTGLLNLGLPRWSAQGDTVFLKPSAPMPFGHPMGMRVDLIFAEDGTASSDLPIIYFTVLAKARVERISMNHIGLAITPDTPTPMSIPVRELAGTDARFSSVRIQFLPAARITDPDSIPSPIADVDTLDTWVTPLYETTEPISALVPRSGVATLEAVATLPGHVARNIPQGTLAMRLTFYGTDETNSPVVLDVVDRVDTPSFLTQQASVMPAMASDLLVQSAVLEWPLHGATIAAGDTLLPRATVTGNGTGGFRAAVYMDGDLIAIEEGYMEAGRPVQVELRGPLPTRKFGEHTIQFQVEAPQVVAASPITFTCVPPAGGLAPPTEPQQETPARPPTKLSGSLRWLAQGRSKFRSEDASAVGWAALRAGYDLTPTRRLAADASFRLRFDDVGNGSGAPQFLSLRYSSQQTSLEWSDAAPAGASETPLLMSPVPRRSAQVKLSGTAAGDVTAYMALDSHPVSSGGSVRLPESDLYAVKIARAFGDRRFRASLYGGYTHEDPTSESPQQYTLRRGIYGGMGEFKLATQCSLLADLATVQHREIEGVEPARSRTGWRTRVSGRFKGFDGRAEGFSYQPDLATALNPYALSNRRGGTADIAKSLWKWNLFAGYRSEEPSEKVGLQPVVRVSRSTIGAHLDINPKSWVTPSLVRVTHRGANTEYVENRIASDYTNLTAGEGRTTARFDFAESEDERLPLTRRRLMSASTTTTRRQSPNLMSTLTLGFEDRKSLDLDRSDTTIQASFEARWEAIPGKLLVTPFLAASGRDYQLEGTEENRYGGRLQITVLRVPWLGENAVAIEGRLDYLDRQKPIDDDSTDGSVMLLIGQRLPIGVQP